MGTRQIKNLAVNNLRRFVELAHIRGFGLGIFAAFVKCDVIAKLFKRIAGLGQRRSGRYWDMPSYLICSIPVTYS